MMYNSLSELPFVSVIIPTYRDWERLSLCLDALKKQTYPAGSFEILVVNNDPDDMPPEELLSLENTKVLTESKPGSYAARNTGVRASKGMILAFTDSDCIPESTWLRNAVAMIMSGNDRIAGEVQLFFENEKKTLAEKYELVTAFNQEINSTNGWCVTANLIVSKQVFLNVGYFDEHLLSGGDTIWGYRCTSMGLQIKYADNVRVFHPARATLGMLFKKARRTSSGLLASHRCKKNKIWWLTGFIPPKSTVQFFRTRVFGITDRIVLSMLAYILKLYGTYHYILLRIRMGNAQRS